MLEKMQWRQRRCRMHITTQVERDLSFVPPSWSTTPLRIVHPNVRAHIMIQTLLHREYCEPALKLRPRLLDFAFATREITLTTEMLTNSCNDREIGSYFVRKRANGHNRN